MTTYSSGGGSTTDFLRPDIELLGELVNLAALLLNLINLALLVELYVVDGA